MVTILLHGSSVLTAEGYNSSSNYGTTQSKSPSLSVSPVHLIKPSVHLHFAKSSEVDVSPTPLLCNCPLLF